MLHLSKAQTFGMLSAISWEFPGLLMLGKWAHGHRIVVLGGVCRVKGKGCSCSWSPNYCPGGLLAAQGCVWLWTLGCRASLQPFLCWALVYPRPSSWVGFPWEHGGAELREELWGNGSGGLVNEWQEHVRLSTSKAVHRGEIHAQPGLCSSNWSHRVSDSQSLLQLMGLVAEIRRFDCEISSLTMILLHTSPNDKLWKASKSLGISQVFFSTR